MLATRSRANLPRNVGCAPRGFACRDSRYRLDGLMQIPHAALLALAASVSFVLVACGESPPARSAQTEMVPSNSAFEAASARPQIVAEPPSSDGPPAGGNVPASRAGGGGPVAVGGTGPAAQTATATVSPNPTPGSAAPEPKGSKPPTRAECTQVVDRYVELEVKSNPQLSAIPPEMLKSMLAQAKQQANAQKGDPCAEEKITRAKYTCAMAAQTPDAWKSCMK